jgi:hypothetical protein
VGVGVRSDVGVGAGGPDSVKFLVSLQSDWVSEL